MTLLMEIYCYLNYCRRDERTIRTNVREYGGIAYCQRKGSVSLTRYVIVAATATATAARSIEL